MAKDRRLGVPRNVDDECVEFLAPELVFRREHRAVGVRPEWARWNGVLERRYTVGVEEEVMVDCSDHSLAQSSDGVLARLSDELSEHVSPETHAATIELAAGIHLDVDGAVAELAALRAQLARELHAMGLGAASAGAYPLVSSGESRVSGSERYRMVADSMRALARREPTLALHVHVGVPDPGHAIRCSTVCVARRPYCSRCRPIRRSAKGATAGSPRRAR